MIVRDLSPFHSAHFRRERSAIASWASGAHDVPVGCLQTVLCGLCRYKGLDQGIWAYQRAKNLLAAASRSARSVAV
ncbi:Hypothetical protein GbCGDNIH7_7131 [Granulibacter bethesdensis]|nr:Hypothetical protein GbCGDNIH7_7131 [Granulibacter bethesdensis]